jgi:hypothetical protein
MSSGYWLKQQNTRFRDDGMLIESIKDESGKGKPQRLGGSCNGKEENPECDGSSFLSTRSRTGVFSRVHPKVEIYSFVSKSKGEGSIIPGFHLHCSH